MGGSWNVVIPVTGSTATYPPERRLVGFEGLGAGSDMHDCTHTPGNRTSRSEAGVGPCGCANKGREEMNAPHTPHGRPRTPREGFRRSTDTGRVSGPPSPTDATTPDTGGRFSTPFADPRHYRGDCRLLRTAVRRGWLDDAPQDVRDALVDRFNAATAEREAAAHPQYRGRQVSPYLPKRPS